MSSRRHRWQTLYFVLCGILGALIEFSIIYLFVDLLEISPYITYIPSALIPAFFVFFFNKNITFRSQSGRTKQQLKRFFLVYSSMFVVNYLLSALFFTIGSWLTERVLVEWFGWLTVSQLAILAKMGAIGLCAFGNYFLSHYFIFPDTYSRNSVVL